MSVARKLRCKQRVSPLRRGLEPAGCPRAGGFYLWGASSGHAPLWFPGHQAAREGLVAERRRCAEGHLVDTSLKCLCRSFSAARRRLLLTSRCGVPSLFCLQVLGSLVLGGLLSSYSPLSYSPFWLRQGGCQQRRANLSWHCQHPCPGGYPSSTTAT